MLRQTWTAIAASASKAAAIRAMRPMFIEEADFAMVVPQLLRVAICSRWNTERFAA